jgi:peptide/nickel transport system permease protein
VTFFKRYLLPRIIQYLVVIFIGTTVVFVVPRLMPTDPIQQTIERVTMQGTYIDPDAVEELKETLKELYGLKGTLFEQYAIFWKRHFRGDFGPSFAQFPTPVMELISISLPWTTILLLLTTLLSWVIGNILGGLAGYFSHYRWARILEGIAMFIRPIPYYIVALGLLILFAFIFPIFPVVGGASIGSEFKLSWNLIIDIIEHAFLPALSLIIVGTSTWFITMRLIVSNIVTEDYVSYAQSGGVSNKEIVFHYVIRNGLLPQITGLALSLGQIFSGALITEQVFSYPGIGTLLYRSISTGDYNLMMGITILSIIGIATGVLIIDIVYPLFDPRIRYE